MSVIKGYMLIMLIALEEKEMLNVRNVYIEKDKSIHHCYGIKNKLQKKCAERMIKTCELTW